MRKPLIITGAVLAGAGIVMGGVFTGLSSAKASDATSAARHDREDGAHGGLRAHALGSVPGGPERRAGSRDVRERVAWSFVAGGAVGAATLIYALAAPRAAKIGDAGGAGVAAGAGGLVVQGDL